MMAFLMMTSFCSRHGQNGYCALLSDVASGHSSVALQHWAVWSCFIGHFLQLAAKKEAVGQEQIMLLAT